MVKMELQDTSPNRRVTINTTVPSSYEDEWVICDKPEEYEEDENSPMITKETLSEREEFYKKYPIDLIQDPVSIDDSSYIRRMFVRRTQTQQSNASTSNQCTNLLFSLSKIEQSSIFNHLQTILIAENSATRQDCQETIAIRVKTGLSGYSHWMNELQVYLLPNFMHENVLNFFGDDIDVRNRIPNLKMTSLRQNNNHDDAENSFTSKASNMKIQYWLLNNFDDCMHLRDYLKHYTLTWQQMISISLGITQGVHYLHEQSEYQCKLNKSKIVDGFIRSTGGAIKKVSFHEQRSLIYMRPHYFLSVIHRNLSTLSIVIRLTDLVPRIWDFSHSYIYHPFQPVNGKQSIDVETRELFLKSQYSPPEVLQEKAYLTLTSMKSIDMYAVGIIFWELISRCVLPVLDMATEEEYYQRANPDNYYEPFELELGPRPTKQMLHYAVCKIRARPIIKPYWLIGKKTNKFVQIFQDLWDHDFDARVLSTTLLDRLDRMSKSDRDLRHKYSARVSIAFDSTTMWPPKYRSTQAPPFPGKCGPNIVFDESSGNLSTTEADIHYDH